MIPEELKRKEGEDIEVMTEDLEVYEAWANPPGHYNTNRKAPTGYFEVEEELEVLPKLPRLPGVCLYSPRTSES